MAATLFILYLFVCPVAVLMNPGFSWFISLSLLIRFIIFMIYVCECYLGHRLLFRLLLFLRWGGCHRNLIIDLCLRRLLCLLIRSVGFIGCGCCHGYRVILVFISLSEGYVLRLLGCFLVGITDSYWFLMNGMMTSMALHPQCISWFNTW